MAHKLGNIKTFEKVLRSFLIFGDLTPDMLMTYLFVWSDRELSETQSVKAPPHMIAIAKALISEDDSGSGSATQSCSAASDSPLTAQKNRIFESKEE